MKLKKFFLKNFANFWPPYLGAGIKVKRISPDFLNVEVEMHLKVFNTNYLGTHFGGSLYSMVDPFYVLMLLENLGPEFIVWDKAATIRFKKPGKGKVRASFHLTQEQVEKIKTETLQKTKTEPVFTVQILNEAGEVIAEVEKTLYVRVKRS